MTTDPIKKRKRDDGGAGLLCGVVGSSHRRERTAQGKMRSETDRQTDVSKFKNFLPMKYDRSREEYAKKREMTKEEKVEKEEKLVFPSCLDTIPVTLLLLRVLLLFGIHLGCWTAYGRSAQGLVT
eukprot:scaffold1984_cov162-Amphora_coffeaeformis.AAC.2